MSDFQQHDDRQPDFRTEPGIWLQNLVYGVWDLVWNAAIYIVFGIALFVGMIFFLMWCQGVTWEDVEKQEAAYYRDHTVIDFTARVLEPHLVADKENYVEVTYSGRTDPLTEARFTVTLTLRNGEEVKIDQFRAAWHPQQEIRLAVPSNQPIEKVALIGSAKHGGENKILAAKWLIMPDNRTAFDEGDSHSEQ